MSCPNCGAELIGRGFDPRYACGTRNTKYPSEQCRIRKLTQDVTNYEAMKEGVAVRIADLEEENARLRTKCDNSLSNNLCPDHRDKQRGKACLACEIERLQKSLAPKITRYQLSSISVPSNVVLELCQEATEIEMWAIREYYAAKPIYCLNKRMLWRFEILYASRDKEFLDHCRWATAEEALAVWNERERMLTLATTEDIDAKG
jgi:hypothetical protein